MSISRRTLNSIALGGLAATLFPPAPQAAQDKYAAILKADGQFGTYTQPWFLNSFLELADDLENARSAGKRFAIMWDQEGCPYCRETHLVNFSIPAVQDYVEANFDIVQMDIRGSREVTNFDGEVMSEKKLAALNLVRFTPTFQFFPETVEEVMGKSGKEAEVARIPGYMKPYFFLTHFQYVHEKAYTKTNFLKYLKSQVADLTAKGQSVPNW
ncbi:MAG: thioredoxin fold domain-containing protein [Rhodospirillaceae bacterium]|nr:thioredoxin fold domain-containing protein [Rhodospirillaceae bacterium]